jgi:hypothetical protein
MNTRETERLKRCIRISSLRKGRNDDWLNVLEEYDELRKGNIKNEKRNINISKIIRQV